MPLRSLDDAEGLIHQVSGREELPPVIYLPGVHGDWTPLVAARPMLSEELRLVEAAYPRVEHWSLEDFGEALEALLDRLGLESAHLVGESFGSLVAWQFGLTHPQRVRSLILVGGFAQPPSFRRASLARRALMLTPTFLLERGIDVYVSHKNRRGEQRRPPSEGVMSYAAVRTTRGRRATANRMKIIQRTDFRPHLHRVAVPVRYIGGQNDLVVPVQRELETLERHLPESCDFQGRLLADARHVIIASHPGQTARHITDWVREVEGPPVRLSEVRSVGQADTLSHGGPEP